MRTLRSKIIAFVLLVLGTAWQFWYLPSLSNKDRRMALFAITLFDVVAVVSLIFVARIKPEQDGVRVEQLGIRHLDYTDLLKCVTVSFFSQSFAFVKTNRRFPFSILLCDSTLDVDSDGKVERIDLAEFLRRHNSELRVTRLS